VIELRAPCASGLQRFEVQRNCWSLSMVASLAATGPPGRGCAYANTSVSEFSQTRCPTHSDRQKSRQAGQKAAAACGCLESENAWEALPPCGVGIAALMAHIRAGPGTGLCRLARSPAIVISKKNDILQLRDDIRLPIANCAALVLPAAPISRAIPWPHWVFRTRLVQSAKEVS